MSLAPVEIQLALVVQSTPVLRLCSLLWLYPGNQRLNLLYAILRVRDRVVYQGSRLLRSCPFLANKPLGSSG